jgi:hypothetical protein
MKFSDQEKENATDGAVKLTAAALKSVADPGDPSSKQQVQQKINSLASEVEAKAEGFKEELKKELATKEDLKGLATEEDLKGLEKSCEELLKGLAKSFRAARKNDTCRVKNEKKIDSPAFFAGSELDWPLLEEGEHVGELPNDLLHAAGMKVTKREYQTQIPQNKIDAIKEAYEGEIGDFPNSQSQVHVQMFLTSH